MIPTWAVVVPLAITAPFVVGWLVNSRDEGSGWFAGLAGAVAFLVTAAAVWPALVVWLVMR